MGVPSCARGWNVALAFLQVSNRFEGKAVLFFFFSQGEPALVFAHSEFENLEDDELVY